MEFSVDDNVNILPIQSLNEAILNNNVEAVKRLIQEGSNLNCIDGYGKTPLHIAVEKEYLSIFEVLLEEGANVDIEDYQDESCLHKAIRQGNLKIVEMLLKLKDDIPWFRYGKAFLVAVECNYVNVVRLLLKNGFNPKENEVILPAVHRAIQNKNLEMATLLLKFGTCVNTNSTECDETLYSSCQIEDILIHSIFFSSDEYEKLWIMEYNTQLHKAVLNGNVKDVELLLESGTDVNILNSDGLTALHLTAFMKSSKASQLHIPKRKNSLSGRHYSYDDKITEEVLQNIYSRSNREYIIELLLKSGASVNTQDVRGGTLLHYASLFGYLEIINILLKYGGDPNVQSEGGFTALNLMLYHLLSIGNSEVQYVENCEKILSAMVKYGGNFNIPDKLGNGLLHKACEAGYGNIVRVILKNGGNPNLQNKWKETPLHKACMSTPCAEIVSLLLSNGSDPGIQDSGGFTALHWACLSGSETCVSTILSKGGNPNVKCEFFKYIPLHMVPMDVCNKNIVSIMMDNGCDPNVYNISGETIVHNACIMDCGEIVEILLHHGGDPYLKNRSGKTAIHLAASIHPCNKSNIKICDFQRSLTTILDKGFSANILDEYKNTPLHEACKNGNEELVQVILNHSGDPNIQNVFLNTPLHELFPTNNKYFDLSPFSSSSKNILLHLLESDVDLNIQNYSGDTPFHGACIGDSPELPKIIMENGGNPNIKNYEGRTPLHEISNNINSTEFLLFVLENGGDVNIRDDEGNSPLHIACSNGFAETVEGLLNSIENPNILNKAGETPLHMAINRNYSGIPHYRQTVSNLLNGGADINIFYRDETPLEMANGLEETASILGSYIVMRKCANFQVNPEDLELINNQWQLENFVEQCNLELDLLKTSTVGKSAVCYYIILVGTPKTLAPLFRNQDLVEIMDTGKYQQSFPIYGLLLKWNFKRALKRKNLIEQVSNSCMTVFHSLPTLCLDKILSFLENDDLRVLASFGEF